MIRTSLIFAVVLLVIAACAPRAEAANGAYISSARNGDWRCLNTNNFTLAIVRASLITGEINPDTASTVISAWAGGMKRVDLSLSLCPHCDTSASDQVSDLVNYIRFYGDKLKYSVIWFDMENGMYVWNDQDFNRAFLAEAINKAEWYGQKIGIFTSKTVWDSVMGNWTGASCFPLWYPSFSDFTPFNGWSQPAMKQYDIRGECGFGMTKNWY